MWQTAYRGKTYQFGWLEQRLTALGFRLILFENRITNRSLEEQVDQIADWLETTGGLNPAESSPNPEFKLCAPLNAKEADPLVGSGLMPAA